MNTLHHEHLLISNLNPVSLSNRQSHSHKPCVIRFTFEFSKRFVDFNLFVSIFRHVVALFFLFQAADMIRDVVAGYNVPIPTVLEIPSKTHAYDESKDSIMKRVLKLLGRD